jgi:hypothetical protein
MSSGNFPFNQTEIDIINKALLNCATTQVKQSKSRHPALNQNLYPLQ